MVPELQEAFRRANCGMPARVCGSPPQDEERQRAVSTQGYLQPHLNSQAHLKSSWRWATRDNVLPNNPNVITFPEHVQEVPIYPPIIKTEHDENPSAYPRAISVHLPRPSQYELFPNVNDSFYPPHASSLCSIVNHSLPHDENPSPGKAHASHVRIKPPARDQNTQLESRRGELRRSTRRAADTRAWRA